MNKADLVQSIANEADLTLTSAKSVLEAFIASVTQSVAKGEDVTLVGFGSFKSSKRAARKGKNPKTGESLKIAATVVPKFSAGATFKAAVAAKTTAKK
jgi:DNA-binding protein HU-beta